MLKVRETLLERVAVLEAQLRKAGDEKEAEAAHSQRLSFAFAAEVKKGDELRQEAVVLEAQRGDVEAEIQAMMSASDLSGTAGQETVTCALGPVSRLARLRGENMRLREELRVLRADSAKDEDLASVQCDLALQEQLRERLQSDLSKARLEEAELARERRLASDDSSGLEVFVEIRLDG